MSSKNAHHPIELLPRVAGTPLQQRARALLTEMEQSVRWDAPAPRAGGHVLRSRDELVALWIAHGGEESAAPEVDFAEKMVVAVFAGTAKTKRVPTLKSVAFDGTTIRVVHGHASKPWSVSNAHALVLVPRRDGDIEIIEDSTPAALEAFRAPRAARPPAPVRAAGSALDPFEARFADALLVAVRGTRTNLVVSPSCARMALAMAYAGAGGETARQMRETLHLGPPATANERFARVLANLADRRALRVTNAFWGARGRAFVPEFLQTLAGSYGALFEALDFEHDPEGSRQRINDVMDEATGGRIRELVSRADVDDQTKVVIASAAYFKAAWTDPFRLLLQTTMFSARGEDTPASFMQVTALFAYAEGTNHQVVELPYEGDAVMRIALPRARDGIDAMASRAAELLRLRLERQLVHVVMPRFRVDSTLALDEALPAMGMQDAFSEERADFSAMSAGRDLFISRAIQRVVLDVDERGTEGAAATAVVGAKKTGFSSASRPRPVEFRADRPFLYWIIDQPTGLVVFAGALDRPS